MDSCEFPAEHGACVCFNEARGLSSLLLSVFCLCLPVPRLCWEGGVVQTQTSETSLCAMFKQADLKASDLSKRGSPQLFSKSLEMRVAEGCQEALLEKKKNWARYLAQFK